MNRNNTIGIVGRITAPVRLIVDAQEWEQKTYETTLTRTRPSGVEDTYTLQFDAAAAGTEEPLETLAEGADVLIGGEIRTEDVKDPKPEENRTKIYIHAEVITQNNPPVKSQNEVSLCGYICKQAKVRTTNRRLPNGRKIKTADTIVAVSTPWGTSYIPCICFGWAAIYAATLKKGDYVEISGRFQSRKYKKRIEGYELLYKMTTREVCVVKIKAAEKPKNETEKPENETEKQENETEKQEGEAE